MSYENILLDVADGVATVTINRPKVLNALNDGKTWVAGCETWEDVEKGCFAIVGSPETVADRIIEHAGEIGCGNLLGLFQLGDMPADKARENARRYAEALDHAMAILQRDREFREDAGRLTMIRIMALMGRGSDVAKRYRRQMFNFLH